MVKESENKMKPRRKLNKISIRYKSKGKYSKLNQTMDKIPNDQVDSLNDSPATLDQITYLIDSSPNPDKCSMCGKSIRKRKNAANSHSICSTCKKKERTKPKPPEIKPPESYICHCDEMFESRRELKKHLRLHNCNGKQSKTTEDPPHEPCTCKVCGEEFDNKLLRRRHVKVHRQENGLYPCQFCGKSFEKFQYLLRHERIHTNEKPYSCRHCDMRFGDCSNRNRHEKLMLCNSRLSHLMLKHIAHKKENQNEGYKCRFCDRVYKQHSRCAAHERTHTGEKPYQCQFCGKMFADVSARKRHERIHTGEKPYQCEYCGSSFNQASTLKQHKLRHTGEKPYSCLRCKKQFSSVSEKRKHDKLKHQNDETVAHDEVVVENAAEKIEQNPGESEDSDDGYERFNESRTGCNTEPDSIHNVPQPDNDLDHSKNVAEHSENSALTKSQYNHSDTVAAPLLQAVPYRPEVVTSNQSQNNVAESVIPTQPLTVVNRTESEIQNRPNVYEQIKNAYENHTLNMTQLTKPESALMTNLLPINQYGTPVDSNNQVNVSSSQSTQNTQLNYQTSPLINSQQTSQNYNQNTYTLINNYYNTQYLTQPAQMTGNPGSLVQQPSTYSNLYPLLANSYNLTSQGLNLPKSNSEPQYTYPNQDRPNETIRANYANGPPAELRENVSQQISIVEQNNKFVASSDAIQVSNHFSQTNVNANTQNYSYNDPTVNSILVSNASIKPSPQPIESCDTNNAFPRNNQVGDQAPKEYHLNEIVSIAAQQSEIIKSTSDQCEEENTEDQQQNIPLKHSSDVVGSLNKGDVDDVNDNTIHYSDGDTESYFSEDFEENAEPPRKSNDFIDTDETSSKAQKGRKTKKNKKLSSKVNNQNGDCITATEADEEKSRKMGDIKGRSKRRYKDREPKCYYCNLTFANRSELEAHKKIHKKEKINQCQFCGKRFLRRGDLTYHENKHNGVRPFACKLCDKTFTRPFYLHQHQKVHIGKELRGVRPPIEKPFFCQYCAKCFSNLRACEEHERTHTGEHPYQCHYCDERFKSIGYRNVHERKHFHDNPFECKQCGRQCTSKAEYEKHYRTHTGEKPFVCRHCGKAFSDPSSRIRHERIHTGEKPYSCSVCGKSFNQSSTLKQHVKSHK